MAHHRVAALNNSLDEDEDGLRYVEANWERPRSTPSHDKKHQAHSAREQANNSPTADGHPA
eukprot:scaffold1864_cov106-Isochrysis_galbana.AAC.8